MWPPRRTESKRGQAAGEQAGCWDSAQCQQAELLAAEEVGTTQLAARKYLSQGSI